MYQYLSFFIRLPENTSTDIIDMFQIQTLEIPTVDVIDINARYHSVLPTGSSSDNKFLTDSYYIFPALPTLNVIYPHGKADSSFYLQAE